MSDWVKSTNEVFRTPVEERVMEHISNIQKAQKLKDIDETYNYIINHWYMFDAFWLQIVCHMKQTGRLQ